MFLRQGTLTESEGISTVDFLVLSSSDQLILRLKILFTFVTKQVTLNEEVNCTEPSPSVSVSGKLMKWQVDEMAS
jgi:hypothetical protein